MNRTNNAIRNIAWGFFQKIVSLCIPFLTRTALIKTLGAEYLGLSSLFTSVLTILSLAELGISNAIISSMYKPIAENDKKLICALMAFYRRTYYCIGVIISCLGIAILPFLPKLINGSVPGDINIYILYIIYLANTVLSYFLFSYKNCLLVAHQRNDVNSKIQTVILCVQNLIQLMLVIVFKNYYFFVIVIPICSVVTNVTTAYFASKYYPDYACEGELPRNVKSDLKQRVMGMFIGRISSTVRGSIDSLYLSIFLGLQMVAIYSNYFYIVTAVVGVIQILESSLVAGVGNSIAVETIQKNHQDFLKFTFLLQWIVGWCSICILCLEQPFMKIWVGEEYMLKDAMVVLCAVYLFVSCICLIRSVYTQALGMWWQLRYLSVIDLFVNISLNLFFVQIWGPYGILAATIVDIVFVSIPWTTYFLFRDYFGMKYYWNYMGLYLKYFIVALITGGITWNICGWILTESDIVGLVQRIIICIIVPNILYLMFFGHNKYFLNVKESVQRKLCK